MSAVIERDTQSALPALKESPLNLLALAIEKGSSIEQLTQLMALQERYDANQAKIHFVAALNAFKANPPHIAKNNTVSFGEGSNKTTYDHATLDHVSDSIGAALAVHNLSHRWDTEQLESGVIKVTCVLTHLMGHSERTTLQAPPDASGKKNTIQSIGSTVTYLQRYTLLAATGMAVKGMDNDGAGDDANRLPEAEYQGFIAKIKKATRKEDAKATWREGVVACEAIGDRDTAEALKVEMLDHCKFIDTASR